MKTLQLLLLTLFVTTFASAQDNKEKTETGLQFRSIGPAFASGRVSDFAVNPNHTSEYYVAFAGGGIWKTTNNGTTFLPIFDNEGSYSIGCLKLDPNNKNILWAGTGENNHQRSVSYGDGVYKSLDGGQSWQNMGLKDSRHIGMIAIDPRDSNTVFVAAEGSLWASDENRGLYQTTDAGKHWKKVLNISKHTGINSVLIDPKNPDVMYATSEQRRRHVHIRIGGGPESAIWKSTDAGKNWRKLSKGLPTEDKGGIGLAISPVDHNYIYAIIEAAKGKGGFFRSTDQGESWQRMSDYNTSGQYYAEIVCDPIDINTVYSTETYSKVTHDGGKTWNNIGNNKRHVDDHAIWIDSTDTKHFIIGGDGGVYETFDAAKHFIHKTNLPVTQFYRVNVDNSSPFYYVYGGTQDNNSFGGPSQTIYKKGTTRAEWIVTLGGDGYWQAIDSENPDIVYSEYQYGNLYRYDRKSGERIAIKPLPRKEEATYKWNWNTPFILSPHNNKRLYMAANKVFQSDDRGNSWTVISEDISRQLSRDKWPVMERFWGVDAVAKNESTSLFGMGVSLNESPVKENLLYVGTDDGVIQITENNGKNWHKTTRFSSVPEYTYVSDILASKHDENVVFASFDNRKRDDFTPYILMSTNKGSTWKSISSNLPKNGTVHCIEQDHVNPNLLFVGTEFGVFYSLDKGKKWEQLKSGLPTISVRDMVIQERENDLVVATFGRGFYILDNYTSLRHMEDAKKKDAYLFPIEDALLYVQKNRGGYGYGSMPYVAKNPEFGAKFTYSLNSDFKTKKEKRWEKEAELTKQNKPIPTPLPYELFSEENEIPGYLIFIITDAQGNEVRRLTKKAEKGIHSINWDLHYAWDYPVYPQEKFDPKDKTNPGVRIIPGTYYLQIDLAKNQEIINLIPKTSFYVKQLDNTTLPAQDATELLKFNQKLAELGRVTWGTRAFHNELVEKVNSLEKVSLQTKGISKETSLAIENIRRQLQEIDWEFNGERAKASYEEIQPNKIAIIPLLNRIINIHNQSTSDLTQKQRTNYSVVKERVKQIIEQLKHIQSQQIPTIEKELELKKAPWTSGRLLEFDE